MIKMIMIADSCIVYKYKTTVPFTKDKCCYVQEIKFDHTNKQFVLCYEGQDANDDADNVVDRAVFE